MSTSKAVLVRSLRSSCWRTGLPIRVGLGGMLLQAWLGTEDQLCRAVKRLQTTSRPSSAVTSQVVDLEVVAVDKFFVASSACFCIAGSYGCDKAADAEGVSFLLQDQSGAEIRPCSADEVNSSLRAVPRPFSTHKAQHNTADAVVQHAELPGSSSSDASLGQSASNGQQKASAVQDQLVGTGSQTASGYSKQQADADGLPGLRADQQPTALHLASPAKQQAAFSLPALQSTPRPPPKAYTISRQTAGPAINRQLPSENMSRQPFAASASISSPSVSQKQKSGSAFPGQTQIVFSNAAASAASMPQPANQTVPQPSSQLAAQQGGQGMSVERREDDSANDDSSHDESAELRGGIGALRLTCNAPAGQSTHDASSKSSMTILCASCLQGCRVLTQLIFAVSLFRYRKHSSHRVIWVNAVWLVLQTFKHWSLADCSRAMFPP